MKRTQALLLSGGLDSTALAALLRPAHLFVIDYGQVCAEAEVEAAQAVADHIGLPLDVIRADCSAIGSGDLSGRASLKHLSPSREWWPYRNQLLVTLAAPLALERGARELLLATVKTDAFHADGTPEFFRLLDAVLKLQEGELGVAAPAVGWTSAELIKRADVGLDLLGWAHSCHTSNLACGSYRGCLKRADVLGHLGMVP